MIREGDGFETSVPALFIGGRKRLCNMTENAKRSDGDWFRLPASFLALDDVMIQTGSSFPGGSRSRVNRAGAAVRGGEPTDEDLKVIDEWRAAHRGVLNTFQSILRGRTRETEITVAQRHKRKWTIFDKLRRFPQMQLANMHDVAGCRLIFRDLNELYVFRQHFHNARFKHKRRNDINKYDYIKSPEVTGYRGVRDVYEYDVNSKTGRGLAGLLVEIQYRTLVQHAWATAVEVVGFVTENQPKFQRGDHRYEQAMALASEILSRAHENSKGPFPDSTNREVVEEFLRLNEEIKLLQILRGLNTIDNEASRMRNAILIMSATGELQVRMYRDTTDALRALFEFEKDMPDRDIVLVRADTTDEVRIAFRNYFSDARDFIQLVEDGCTGLTGAHQKGRRRRSGSDKKS